MKKKLISRISVMIIAAMVCFFVVNYVLQALSAQKDMINGSEDLFWQLEQMIRENEADEQTMSDRFRDICILRTRAAAYMIEHNDASLDDMDELKKIMGLLEVSEIHIFDRTGTVISGTVPESYGMNMADMEQSSFFLPMLRDASLTLFWEAGKNTAQEKRILHAAAWTESGAYIVQCSMAPMWSMESLRQNEISALCTLMPGESGYMLYVADPESYEILGSTKKDYAGKSLEDIGIYRSSLEKADGAFHAMIDGELCYCVFRKQGSMLVGRSCNIITLYANLNRGNVRLLCYIAVILFLVIYSIYRYLDKNVVQSIHLVNEKLMRIAAGNLSERVEVTGTEEFTELSGHINYMVRRLLGTTEKMSELLGVTDIPIGIYEYNIHMSDVRTTTRTAQIIGVEGEDAQALFGDYRNFERWMQQLKQRPSEYADSVYILSGKRERYVQIYAFEKDGDRYGLVADKTEEVRKWRELELKLGQDELTGLCSRHSFYEQMDALFQEPKRVDGAVLLMIDSDDLKTVNDTYGHESGDRYLCGVAKALREIGAPGQITARLSGDEFAVFIYGLSEEERTGYLERLFDSRDAAYVTLADKTSFPVRFSVGCAFCTGGKADYHLLLEQADKKMYQDKQMRKKNRRGGTDV